MWGFLFALATALTSHAAVERAQVTYAFWDFESKFGVEDVLVHLFANLDRMIEARGGVAGHIKDRLIFGLSGDGIEDLDEERLVLRLERILEQGDVYDGTHYTLAGDAWFGLSLNSREDFEQALSDVQEGAEELTDGQLMDACEMFFLPPVRN